MARKLTAGVVLRHPGSGVTVFLPSGSEVPDWAADEVGEHVLESDDLPEGRHVTVTEPPPKAGPGSARARWVEYASAHGVVVTEDATREDIIAACEAAGVPTE